MKTSLEHRLGHEVPREHDVILTSMLNNAWGSGIAVSDTMRSRLESGQLFVLAYDYPTDSDREYLGRELGIVLGCEKIPVGILETIDLKTGGDYSAVPKDYHSLTNDGEWRKPSPDSDTTILVDVTVLASRRGSPKKEAQSIVHAARTLLGESRCGYIWSYTPDIAAVKRWHEGLGAKDSEFVIPDARPWYRVPDVNMMDYSK